MNKQADMNIEDVTGGVRHKRQRKTFRWVRQGGWAATDRLATQWFLSRIGYLNYCVYSIICSFSHEPKDRWARLRITLGPAGTDWASIMRLMPDGTHERTVRAAVSCLREYGLISTRDSDVFGELIFTINDTEAAKKCWEARELRESQGISLADLLEGKEASNHGPQNMGNGPSNHGPQNMGVAFTHDSQNMGVAFTHDPQTMSARGPLNREEEKIEEEKKEGALHQQTLPGIGGDRVAPAQASPKAKEQTPVRKGRILKQSPDNYPDQFKLLREAYPKKTNLQDEIRAWDCVALSEALADMLVARAKIYRTYSDVHVALGFVPHLTTWLNQGRYDNPESTMMGLDPKKPLKGQAGAFYASPGAIVAGGQTPSVRSTTGMYTQPIIKGYNSAEVEAHLKLKAEKAALAEKRKEEYLNGTITKQSVKHQFAG